MLAKSGASEGRIHCPLNDQVARGGSVAIGRSLNNAWMQHEPSAADSSSLALKRSNASTCDAVSNQSERSIEATFKTIETEYKSRFTVVRSYGIGRQDW